jgi:hypothetical protein
MAVKVTVVSDTRNRISINNQNRKNIRTVAITPDLTTLSSLSALNDVVATDPNENETLVYDEASGKYIVKILPNISGGIF